MQFFRDELVTEYMYVDSSTSPLNLGDVVARLLYFYRVESKDERMAADLHVV